MTVRNVEKNLATMQDLAIGRGKVTQSRGGVNYDVNRIDTPFAVDSLVELKALDVTAYTVARVYFTDQRYYDYIYIATETLGIAPDTGAGTWVPRERALNYEMFGADITGVAVFDTYNVQCHAIANKYGLPVKQSFGTFYWQNLEATVQTPCDNRGMIVRVDSNSGTTDLTYSQPGMWNITSAKSVVELDAGTLTQLNTTYSAYFKKYSQRLPEDVFGIYSGRYIEISSNVLEVNRNGNTLNPKYAQENTSTSRKGQLESPIYHDLQGNVTAVKVYPREDFRLYFYAPKIVIDQTPSFRVVKCTRSNTQIEGLILQEEQTTWPSNIREIVEIYNCSDVTVSDFDALSPPQGATVVGGIYTIVAGNVLRMKVYRIRSNGGVSSFASNYVRDMIFKDCYMNRIDCHFGGYDILIDGCTTINMGISVSGGGHLKVTNHVHKQTGPISSPYGETFVQAIVQVRPDHAAHFDGDIIIDGAKIVVDATFITELVGRNHRYAGVAFYPDIPQSTWGTTIQRGKRVEVRNVALEFDPSIVTTDSTFQFKAVDYNQHVSGDAIFPQEIIVDNISVTNEPSDFAIIAYEPPNYMHPSNRAMYDAAAGEFNQKITVRDIMCSTRVLNNRAEFGLVKFTQGWNQTAGVYAAYLTDVRAIRPKIVIDNCERVSVGLGMIGSCYIKGGSVSQLQTTTSSTAPYKPTKDQVYVRVDEADIELISSTALANVFESNDRVYAFNCNFGDGTEIDGGKHPALLANSYHGRGNKITASTTVWTSTTPYLFDGDNDKHMISGAGTPIGSVTPDFPGQEYQNTTTGTWFKAMGIANTDWNPVGGFTRLIAAGTPSGALVVDFIGQRYIDTTPTPHEEYYAASLTTGDWVRLD